MRIEIERPYSDKCTGCPMSNLFTMQNEWHYGCNFLHKEMKTGGEYRNYAYKDKDCPFIRQEVLNDSK